LTELMPSPQKQNATLMSVAMSEITRGAQKMPGGKESEWQQEQADSRTGKMGFCLGAGGEIVEGADTDPLPRQMREKRIFDTVRD